MHHPQPSPETYRKIARPIINQVGAGQIFKIIQDGSLDKLADIIIEEITTHDTSSSNLIDKNRILHILNTYNIPGINNSHRITLINALQFLSIEKIEDRYDDAINDINPLLQALGKSQLPVSRSSLTEIQQQAIRDAHVTHNINPFLLNQDQLNDKKNILKGAGFSEIQSLLLLQSFVCGNWFGNCVGTLALGLLLLWAIKEFGTTTSTSRTYKIHDVTFPEEIVVSGGSSQELDSVVSKIMGFTALKTVFKSTAHYELGYKLGGSENFKMNIYSSGSHIIIGNVLFPDTISRDFTIDGPHDIAINRQHMPDIVEDQLKSSLVKSDHRDSVLLKEQNIRNEAQENTYRELIGGLIADPDYYRDVACAIAKGIGGSYSNTQSAEIHFQNGVSFFLQRQPNGTYLITKNKGLENLGLKN